MTLVRKISTNNNYQHWNIRLNIHGIVYAKKEDSSVQRFTVKSD